MTEKSSKKNASKSALSQSTASEPAVASSQEPTQDPGARPPKGAFGRKTPKDWSAAKLGRGKGARLNGTQASNAAVAGKEVGSSTTYAQDFGPHAPSQAQLAHLLSFAAAWRGEWTTAKRYASYAAEQNADWWEAVQESKGLFQPAFDYAVARDPSLVEKYPSLTQFMQAAATIAKRAAGTRKAAAKTAAKGKATVTAQATEPAAADAVAAAPAAAEPATEATATASK